MVLDSICVQTQNLTILGGGGGLFNLLKRKEKERASGKSVSTLSLVLVCGLQACCQQVPVPFQCIAEL